MSLHLPARRALGTAPTILKTLRPTVLPPTTTSSAISPCLLLVAGQARHAATKKNTKSVTHSARGVVNRQKPKDLHKTLLGDLAKSEDRQGVEETLRGRMSSTRLESQSIFDEELKNVNPEDGDARDAPLASDAAAKALRERKTLMGASTIADHMRIAVDPDPRSRRRWERKMVIQRVTRALDVRGKETREERLKRTEREALSKSVWLATSVKKLMHLARQISGKTLEEARTQMKFSKKKFAKEVLYELDLARDKAVVERGMGLGKVNGEFVPGQTEKKTIRDHRHGKWVDVVDPTRLYVHEAWVNRGPWRGKRPNYRAKGRTDVIQMPQASITIRLKEEKSRVREHEEKKAKEYRQGPWIHLPDRPVTAQRPFYTW